MMTTALSAARLACETSDWRLTNLQLQKILYIAHMLYSGRSDGNPLVEDERFEAWDYGPVLPKVYRLASVFGSRPVGNVFHGVGNVEDKGQRELIEETVRKLANVSPFRLVEITHQPKGAWHGLYEPGVRGIAIPQAEIVREYNDRFVKLAQPVEASLANG